MKASVARYDYDDTGESQIVIRMCPENAEILREILGSADPNIHDTDGGEEPVDDGCIVSPKFFEELTKVMRSKEQQVFSLNDQTNGYDYIDFAVVRKGK